MIPESLDCPFCRGHKVKEISGNFFLCKNCKIVFNTEYQSLSYDRDYFIKEYKEQYGKTYIEDFDNIYSLSSERLNRIFRLHRKTNPDSLLDIGSAAGFFLKAAADKGIDRLLGIEISQYASSYCINNFKIPVIHSPFDSAGITDKFDIISAWFFLEHCGDPAKEIKKIYELLNDGGVLALAMPSYFGPLFTFDREKWIKTHPGDHRIDVSPGGAEKILKEAGFRKVKTYSCGFHPERVLKSSSLFFRPFSYFYKKFAGYTSYSDTIEIYAVK